ncbi:MAG: ribbon-helix-helix protein, CopG family [Akkermansiaceae bacterium]
MTTKEKMSRSTVYLDPELHRALKLQAAETGTNVSELINRSIRESLREDREDLKAFEERSAEATISFETLIQRLDLDGKV